MHPLRQARFLASAARPAEFPPRAGPEVVFAGRSNVGKSSAINALAERRRLAFVSKTPGRTRTINFFELASGGRLVDLPGYGYASAPRAGRAGWDRLITHYLAGRSTLAGVVLLTDARRPLAPSDRHFLEWLAPVAAPRLVLLAKSDKLSRAERARALAQARHALAQAGFAATALLFSSRQGEGLAEARALVERWLGQEGK
ncbi:MAG: ribosome biogenesis GTP-binding protein YihA/YsxC [Pseudomonadota bacterium]